jgi:hypothetical protein
MGQVNFRPNTGGISCAAESDGVSGSLFKLKAAMFPFLNTVLFLFSEMHDIHQ